MPKIIKKPLDIIFKTSQIIINNEGINSLSIRKIAKESGISIGTIYNYFENKDALIIKLMEQYWKESIYLLNEKKYLNQEKFLDDLYEVLCTYQKTYKDFWKNNSLNNIPQIRSSMIKKVITLISNKTKLKNPEFILQNLMATATWNFIEYSKLKKILLNKEGV
ncbi:hypothetical protein OSSY52_01240 [Tepiditoga spiralis]|uniref:HTH tetR-type domain-containing protein n=1 Tax=Tepiditoga spiralis TaxID=2108365 RepID=A0A7G1G5C1_9BACT|nr:TetR/AcrR family transcriptional regulator [Tepiditoga spiralis]BBE29983.1 hypothetical protein OSSY52_01240 [Tepiditoga spiralis]